MFQFTLLLAVVPTAQPTACFSAHLCCVVVAVTCISVSTTAAAPTSPKINFDPAIASFDARIKTQFCWMIMDWLNNDCFSWILLVKIGDLKGFFGLIMSTLQLLRTKLKVLDASFGDGTANTALVYHHGQLLVLGEADKPYVIRVLEDGDLQTIGMMDYDKRLTHSFTAHPKVDPVTGEMFTFGYSRIPPYITYRVISKEGVMQHPVPITVPVPIMMHDFAITENYTIFMDLPLYFRPKEMAKENKLVYSYDPTKESRFGILPRYAKNEALIKWFELPNCFIFHNANAWEEGVEVVLINCRFENGNLDIFNGSIKEKFENFTNELYEMRFNLKSGMASQKKLSASAVDFPTVNERFTGR